MRNTGLLFALIHISSLQAFVAQILFLVFFFGVCSIVSFSPGSRRFKINSHTEADCPKT